MISNSNFKNSKLGNHVILFKFVLLQTSFQTRFNTNSDSLYSHVLLPILIFVPLLLFPLPLLGPFLLFPSLNLSPYCVSMPLQAEQWTLAEFGFKGEDDGARASFTASRPNTCRRCSLLDTCLLKPCLRHGQVNGLFA